jgi:nicotinamidase-related amidase
MQAHVACRVVGAVCHVTEMLRTRYRGGVGRSRRRAGGLGQPEPIRSKASAKSAQTALLLVDVINTLDFPGSDALIRETQSMSRRIADLADRARAAGIPVVYVNDNFGRWRSDWRQVIDACLAEASPGRVMTALLQPHPEDYFVLKPKHSGFYSTTLDLLLRDLGVDTVIVTGVATDICILFTANDAYMRGYSVVVPSDCVAANTPAKSSSALEQMRTALKARTPSSRRLSLRKPSRPGR